FARHPLPTANTRPVTFVVVPKTPCIPPNNHPTMALSTHPEQRTPLRNRLYYWAPWLIFGLMTCLMLFLDPFPALYGDEYWSMAEAQDLTLNPAGIGYFSQLKLVMLVTDNDCLLRSVSLFWAAVSLWALRQWLDLEPLPPATRFVIVLLWVINPFLWV